jgi:hypothetical protein
MTYTELRQVILDFAVDTETTFADNIDNFIRATEKRIYNDAKLPVAQLQAAPTMTAGVADIAVPDNFLSTDSFAITVAGSFVYLLPKTVDFLNSAFPTTTQGVPRYFAVKDEATLRVAPVPDSGYTVTLRYAGYPESIVDAASGTTWLGDNYEFALQYGALRDAAVFLKEEADVVDMYSKSYMEALGQIKTFAADRARTDVYRRRG